MTKLKKYYCDNSNSEEELFFTQSFAKNNLTPQQSMRCILANVLLNKLSGVRTFGRRICL